MDDFDEAISSKGSRWGVYVWGGLAVLTCPCPCHLPLPLPAALLAGTTAGAVIGEH